MTAMASLLAENRPVFSLTILPERVEDMEALLADVQKIVDVREADIENFRQRLNERRRPFEAVALRYHLTEDEMARLAVNRHRLPGVETDARLVRYYPYGKLTSHVLGYVGRINKQDMQRLDPVRYAGTHYTGKTGLERVYEDELHGDVGYQNVETNARGRVMRVLEREDPEPGRDLTINLDIRLQHIAQQAMGDKRGAIVAINPETGGILAQLSTPGFDTNKFVTGIDHESYANLRDSLDTPCSTALPVGSIHPAPRSNPSWPLPGWIRTPSPSPAWSMTRGTTNCQTAVRCSGTGSGGHGDTTLSDAITLSSDTYFYDMAHNMGVTMMADYLRGFGFGSATSLDVRDERSGILPTPEWKRRVQGEVWYPGDSVNMGIGQGISSPHPCSWRRRPVLLPVGDRLAPRHLRSVDGGLPAHHLLPDVVRPPLELGRESDWEYVINAMVDVVHSSEGTARGINRGWSIKWLARPGPPRYSAWMGASTTRMSSRNG